MTDELTSLGLNIDSFETRLDRIISRLRSEIDPLLELSENDEVGQLIRIVTDEIQQVADLAQPVWTAFDPSQASGHSLTMLGLITGSKRSSGAFGSVELTVNLDGGTTLDAGKIAGTGQADNQWATDVDVVAPAGPAADYTVQATCVNRGEIIAPATTIQTIITPATGWNSVNNLSDADEGEPAEEDSLFRQVRDQEISASGSSSLPSVEGVVSQVDGVEEVTVYMNTRHFISSLGIPPNSFETVIWVSGGVVTPGSDLDQDIIDAVFSRAPMGVYPYGQQGGFAQTSKGTNYEVNYTVANSINVLCSIVVVKETGYAGDDAVKDAINTYIDGLTVGQSVRRSGIIDVVEDIQGVDYVDLSLGPLLSEKPNVKVAADLVIAYNQKAVVDVLATDIIVTSI